MHEAEAQLWNHNLHFHPRLLDAIPRSAKTALDVGCGEGLLPRRLRARIDDVTGIDPDETSIALARAHGDDITYVVGDVLTYPFAPASFDVVTAVAMLHHVDMETGLRRMRELVAPGGVLGVVGLARSRRPADLPYDAACVVSSRWHKRGKTEFSSPAPIVWPPPVTYSEARSIAERVLPGVAYQRHLLWRYTLVWVNRSS